MSNELLALLGMQGVAANAARHRDNQLRVGQLAMSTSTHMGGAEFDTYSGRVKLVPGYLDSLTENVDPDKAFQARQLVIAAQHDYNAALARASIAEASASRAKLEAQGANTTATLERQRADAAEARLRALQPEIRRALLPSTPSSGSHELRWPWLAASWALFLAGVAVCAL